MTDFLIIIWLLGLRVSEYAQTMQNEIDLHTYPSGKWVIKAFTPRGLYYLRQKQHNNQWNEYCEPTDLCCKKSSYRWNVQSITLKADKKHPEICPVRAVHRILQWVKRLGQDNDQPLGVFINHYGIKKYLTGSKIAKLLQMVARKVHPHMTREEINRFSLQSGSV
jgi:hypothetical protein